LLLRANVKMERINARGFLDIKIIAGESGATKEGGRGKKKEI